MWRCPYFFPVFLLDTPEHRQQILTSSFLIITGCSQWPTHVMASEGPGPRSNSEIQGKLGLFTVAQQAQQLRGPRSLFILGPPLGVHTLPPTAKFV
jgi:hypothetical protein